jgi:heat-inducible transcriptional repressor
MVELKPRQKAILSAVVERYVRTAEPVGSAAIAHEPQLLARFGALSSATIRNELAELEALGYLMQPHTSAGRVPTDLGYRLYVNEMMQPRPILAKEQVELETVAPPQASFEDALREATTILARLTGYPAVASLPSAGRDAMRQIQLSPVPPRQLILVLVTAAGRIEHRLFDVDDQIPPSRLVSVVNFLNENFGSKPLSSVRSLSFETLSRGLHDEATLRLAKRAWEMVRQSVADIADERIVVQGLITLLDEPEFAEIAPARAAMRLFEDELAIEGLLRDAEALAREMPTTHTVRIGRELPPVNNPAVQWFSFVGVSYGVGGESLGALGVLGPARMRYADAVSLVPALAARLQICLESF